MKGVEEKDKEQTEEEQEKKIAVKMASEVLQSLSKAMKALKLYPDTSPIKQKFISDYFRKHFFVIPV